MAIRRADGRNRVRASLPVAAVVLAASLACGGEAASRSGAPLEGQQGPALAAPPALQGQPPSSSPAAPVALPMAVPTVPAPEPPSSSPAPPASEPPATPSTASTPPEPTPAAALSVDGCLYVGGYDRVFIDQRDAERDICATLVLVGPDDSESPFDLTGLALPPGWTVDEMSAFPCAADGNRLSDTEPNHYRTALGSVSFVLGQGGYPTHASVDARLLHPSEDVAALPYPDPLIAEQRISADHLQLQGSCRPR